MMHVAAYRHMGQYPQGQTSDTGFYLPIPPVFFCNVCVPLC